MSSFDQPDNEILPDEAEIKTPQTQRTALVVGGILLGLFALLMVIRQGVILFTNTQFAAPDAQANRTATAQAAQTRLNQQTLQAGTATMRQLRQQASSWPIRLRDDFSTNNNDWYEGEIDETLITLSAFIQEGRFTWQAQAKDSVVYRFWPAMDPLGDIYLSVEAQNLSENPYMLYGVVFRQTDDAYYIFNISDDGFVEVYLSSGGEWQEFLTRDGVSAIQPGEPNLLEVIIRDEMAYFAVNGIFVGQTQVFAPPEGIIGLDIELSEAGETGSVAFDNLLVRAP